MDSQYFGSNLLALNQVQNERRRGWTDAAEHAYYAWHAPVERRAPNSLLLLSWSGMGVVAIGLTA